MTNAVVAAFDGVLWYGIRVHWDGHPYGGAGTRLLSLAPDLESALTLIEGGDASHLLVPNIGDIPYYKKRSAWDSGCEDHPEAEFATAETLLEIVNGEAFSYVYWFDKGHWWFRDNWKNAVAQKLEMFLKVDEYLETIWAKDWKNVA